MKTISVIDSHTGGEPTRIIVENGPDLGPGTLADRAAVFAENFDHVRTAAISEPRGSEFLVGGLLCNPVDPKHAAGIIFFDNAGLLGMCGHGTIGLCVTLNHLGLMDIGEHRIETPVGLVDVKLSEHNKVTVRNVVSYRTKKDVKVDNPVFGTVVGDVAWGGNWFFLTDDSPCSIVPNNIETLLAYTKAIRTSLAQAGITGPDGEPVNHVEVHGQATVEHASAKNFVLCPGGSYDRSPCGTGTSAKLACLAADGKLRPGEKWKQESIVGSIFETSFEHCDAGIIPTITGTAHVSGENKLILDPTDPFCHGILA